MLGQPFLLCFQQQRNPGFGFVVGVSYAEHWFECSLVREKFASMCKDSGYEVVLSQTLEGLSPRVTRVF